MTHPASSRRRGWLLGLAAALLGVAQVAAQPADVASLFPLRAAVRLEATGGTSQPLARLVLPIEVLEQTRADLSDLRLLDDDGREVPFLVEPSPHRGSPAGSSVRLAVEAWPRLVGMGQSTVERDNAAPLRRERYDLEPPPTAEDPAAEGPWTLVVDSGLSTFVRSVDLLERDAAGAEEALLEGGSLFRLADGRELRRYVLPPLRLDSVLVVWITGEDASYLVPAFRYQRSRRVAASDDDRRRARATLVVLESRQERGDSVLELERPAGIVPQALVLETTSAAFRRPIEVRDLGAGGDGRRLGAGVLFRVPATGETLEHLRIDLLPARGTKLEVRIADGDSPPLEIVAAVAEITSPALLFAPPRTGGVTLYCGGGRARRPLYDLAGLLPDLPARDESARIGAALLDPQRATAATLLALESNTRHAAGPVLAAAMRPGAELDARLFSHQRRLTVPGSDSGLARLELRPEDLAQARADLADLRVADSESRQWPYLVRQGTRSEHVALRIEATSANGRTKLELAPVAAPLEMRGLELDIATPFFDRPFQLEAELPDGGGTVALARGVLRRHDPDGTSLTIAFAPRRVSRLLLTIDDGSEQPLEVRGSRAAAPIHELLFPAPAGPYRLLLGFADSPAPVYDLARNRAVVFALDAATVESGPLEPNPDVSAAARWGRGQAPQRLMVWAAIGLAVVVLTVLTLRLASRHEENREG
ncbi:MAG TPA: hypothetical protein VNB06_00850 [Thermoanaerobaculia bacterium]|nr:hypothetical protein [Thermoanaerobaculia bacterium]